MVQLYTMNANGGQQVRLTSGELTSGQLVLGESRPTWSPDGRRTAYASKYEGVWKIYVINSDGTGEAQLITAL